MCKISVLMSVYNESVNEIKEAINSVLNQTFQDFELIIVNDNPEKKTYDYIFEEIKDERVTILKNDSNIGLALSMNKAANQAKGEYFARMDADDICLPTRFEKELDILKNNISDVVCTNYTIIDENSVFTKNGMPSVTNLSYGGRITPEQIVFQAVIHHPTVMMTRKIFESVEGYNNYPCAQDHDLWLRMLEKRCKFYFIDEVLLYYRVRENSVSKKTPIKQHLTIYYSSNLFIQRINGKKGDFSEELYNNFINSYKIKHIEKSYTKARELLTRETHNQLNRFLCRIRVFIKSSVYRKTFLQKIRYTKLVREKFSIGIKN